MSKFKEALAILLLTILFNGCNNSKYGETLKNLKPVIWVQTSVEYRMLCEQTYKMALSNINKALSDSNWTACLEQCEDYKSMPPAIIMDVDETVLDNSPFTAGLIKSNIDYSEEQWQAWVNEQRAEAIPGAKAFVRKAKEMGIKVFFVTNRKLKEPTVNNLQNEIDSSISQDDVMCKSEMPEWRHSKVERRKIVGEKYRILLLIGDDYNDFEYLGEVTPKERIEKANLHQVYWGEKWFILPNPVYGSFENSLYISAGKLSDSERLSLKLQLLKN